MQVKLSVAKIRRIDRKLPSEFAVSSADDLTCNFCENKVTTIKSSCTFVGKLLRNIKLIAEATYIACLANVYKTGATISIYQGYTFNIFCHRYSFYNVNHLAIKSVAQLYEKDFAI